MSKYRKTYRKYDNENPEWIYVFKSNKKTDNKILIRELILNKFLEKTMLLLSDFSLKAKYIEYIFFGKRHANI